MNPSVAVVIPCYNCEVAIAGTIEALLAQSHRPDEIIVVDDGSTDRSAAVAESFGPPVQVLRQANAGAAAARHAGVMFAKSEIVMFNDAGDLSLPLRVEGLRQALIDNPACVAAFGVSVDAMQEHPVRSRFGGEALDGSVHIIPDPLSTLIGQSFPLAGGMNFAVRRDVALESTRINPFYRAGNDYAVQIKTARFGPFAYVAEVSLTYELLHGGLTEKFGWMQQTGFALCAATEVFEWALKHRGMDAAAFRSRVEADWPGVALFAYLRGNFGLLRRVIVIGLRYGRAMNAVRRFWWALDKAYQDQLLERRYLLRQIALIGRALKR